MIRKIIKFVLTLVVGAALGYLLSPTIDKTIEGTQFEQPVDKTSEAANNVVAQKLQ